MTISEIESMTMNELPAIGNISYGSGYKDGYNAALCAVKARLRESKEAEPGGAYPVTLLLGMAFDHYAEHHDSSVRIEMEPGKLTVRLFPTEE